MLVNNGLITEEKLGNMLQIKPGHTFANAKDIYKQQLDDWHEAIDRVSDLFLRMNTRDAEVAATVDFVAHSLEENTKQKPSEMDVLKGVASWKAKKKPALEDEEIAKAVRKLHILKWLDLKPSTNLPLPEDPF